MFSCRREMAGVFKIFSLLAQYPSDALLAGSAEIVSAVGSLPPDATKSNLQKFLAYWCATPPAEVRSLYIQSFELATDTTLHLTYHRYGDGKERGAALLRLKQQVNEAGYYPATRELPDYLPLLLEFASVSPAGLRLIDEYRAPIEAIRWRLEGAGHAYAPLFGAITQTLPPLTESQREEATAILQKRGTGSREGKTSGRVTATGRKEN